MKQKKLQQESLQINWYSECWFCFFYENVFSLSQSGNGQITTPLSFILLWYWSCWQCNWRKASLTGQTRQDFCHSGPCIQVTVLRLQSFMLHVTVISVSKDRLHIVTNLCNLAIWVFAATYTVVCNLKRLIYNTHRN